LEHFRHPFLIVIAFALCVCGCDSEQIAELPAPPSVLSVNVSTVKIEKEYSETVVFFGKLSPGRQNSLGFKKPGQLNRLAKAVGQSALAGEVLAELDQTQLQSQKSPLQQSYQSLEEQLQASGLSDSQELANLREQLNAIDLELAKGVIVAPYDCLLAASNVELGEAVGPQRPVIRVIENAPAVVEVDLPTRIADDLALGQTVWVKINESAFSAAITTKSPTVSSTGNKRLTLMISEDPQNATAKMIGETVKVEFLKTSQSDGFWVPQSALVGNAGGLWSVMVVSPEESDDLENQTDRVHVVVQKIVEIVSAQNDRAFVKGSLVQGERIISNGTHRIVPGQRIVANDLPPVAVSDGGNSE